MPYTTQNNSISVDLDTGEVLGHFVNGALVKQKVHKHLTKYIGTDIKHLSNCVTEDQILDYTKQVDYHFSKKVKVNYPLVMDYLQHMSSNRLRVLLHLCTHLFVWNYYSVNVNALEATTGVPNARRELRNLESSGLIRFISRGTKVSGTSKGDILIAVAPTLSFRGGYGFRDDRIRRWYS